MNHLIGENALTGKYESIKADGSQIETKNTVGDAKLTSIDSRMDGTIGAIKSIRK